MIAADNAVAQADAAQAYRDLSVYRIQLVLEADGWHIDCEPKDPRLKGGGAALGDRRGPRGDRVQAVRAVRPDSPMRAGRDSKRGLAG